MNAGPPGTPAILRPPDGTGWFDNPAIIGLVGRKARGLSLFPGAWRPPLVVLTSETHAGWARGWARSDAVLAEAAAAIELASREWRQDWPRGLILRSSADTETLEDRGANESVRLAADFGAPQVEEALGTMFRSFGERAALGHLAVVVQPLVGEGSMGHLSNERRVSKTVNQWLWERLSPDTDQGRLNSQRDNVPDPFAPLAARPGSLERAFGAVGRWVTGLGRGPAHLEWVHDGQTLWLLQIDFEHEQPDDGVDPNAWLREADHLRTGTLPPGSLLTAVDLDPASVPGPWRKVENVRRFAAARREPYPPLATIAGDRLLEALASGREALEADLDAFAHGRIVCRTDCRMEGIDRENLPRTNTVSSASAVDHMLGFLNRMAGTGATPGDICFLAHKFIPARSGAWASANPASPIVRVDALWGVPDGLQYLPHDTFDVDVRREAVSAERLRYKPRFIQECPDGMWQELRVRRALGRIRSLSAADAVAVSIASHAIASRAGRPLLVMWFCGIPPGLGIGTNLPWFSMPPNPAPALLGEAIFPRWPRTVLRTLGDVGAALTAGAARSILVLDPELVLFRDGDFLSEVIRLAKRDHCPVQLARSTLAHAHYQLEKAGVVVVPADGPSRSRARGRRSFAKLVRDDMPSQIADRGEVVVQSRLPRSEMRRALTAKLLEEAQELLAATDPDDVKAELADLLEVVRAMAGVTGVGWVEVEVAASEKRERRGGFEDGAVLVGTEWPTADRTVQRAPPMVTLRSLGKVVSDGRHGTASYNALLASGDGLEVEVGGRRIGVRLTRDGIDFEAEGVAANLPAQLALPLGDDPGARSGDG